MCTSSARCRARSRVSRCSPHIPPSSPRVKAPNIGFSSSALAMKRRLPDARMIVLEQAGHCAMLERPDQFNEVVERFLAEVLAPRKQRARA